MSIRKTFAAIAAGSLLVTGLAVATAGSASAADDGPALTGHIYLLNATINMDTAKPSNVITGGNGSTRPWMTIASDTACPAGSIGVVAQVRIPQVGVDPINWDEVLMDSITQTLADSQGRLYNPGNVSNMTAAKITAYVATQPNTTGTLPLALVCYDGDGLTTGYFSTDLTVSGTTAANLTWSVPAPPALAQTATTTALAASASSVEAGTAVTFTAHVAPAAASGSVNFMEGATTLGTGTLAGGVATFSSSALAVGTHSVTAVYAGVADYTGSTSTPVSVTVTTVASKSTTTTLSVSPVSGDAYQSVAFTTTVTASSGAANGNVAFLDGTTSLGSLPVTAGVVAAFSTNVLGAGAHSLTAVFTGTAPYTNSTSAAISATYVLVGASDEQTVVVTIPIGTITITTPYTPGAPLNLGTAVLDPADSTYSASAAFNNIVITDTRNGDPGFTASVVSGTFTGTGGQSTTFGGNYAGLTGLGVTQLPSDAMLSSNVHVTNNAPFTPGLGTSRVFATYAAGLPGGTTQIDGTFGIDQVPSSVAAGQYTATVTFTAV
jgi:Bacterial Ig-like domain (group 3)